jgi:hypothetical protein
VPEISWEYSPTGLRSISRGILDDGKVFCRLSELVQPNALAVAL